MCITAFQRKEPVDYVTLELNKRIKKYRTEQLEICKKNIIKEAEIYVDSIISLQMNEAFIDTIKSPPKPPRPLRPYDTLRLDSTDLSPLIKTKPDSIKIKD
jgi:hypothetical protein